MADKKQEIFNLFQKLSFNIDPEFDILYDKLEKEEPEIFERQLIPIYDEIDNSKIFNGTIKEIIEYLQSLCPAYQDFKFEYDSEEDYLMLYKRELETDKTYANRCYFILSKEKENQKIIQKNIKKKLEIIDNLQNQLNHLKNNDFIDEDAIKKVQLNLKGAKKDLKNYKQENNID